MKNNFRCLNKLIYKVKQFMMTPPKKNPKKSPHILEDNASGVQVGDIKQATPLKFV